jgi:ethanolamine transporter EutH
MHLRFQSIAAAPDVAALISDLQAVHQLKAMNDREDQVKVLFEQLTSIFTRAHLDGIKTVLQAMASSISGDLRESIDRIEASLRVKLTESEQIIIESYIHDHLISLVGSPRGTAVSLCTHFSD